ncbi:MAG: hypothetical protein GX122_05395 [Candidatus Cloacimonetes bacterium]|nr:hypothetical protein [Candidatus Cloacimonadota bacterium]NLO11843.1 hypothetical protein [Candidatus Cloacimonadota bacterium]
MPSNNQRNNELEFTPTFGTQLHIGVAYGKFDHYRLIDCIRLCEYAPDETSDKAYMLGLEEGGLNSAEALMLARYYMFNQVYFHRLRRIYDYHLRKFFLKWIGSIGLDRTDPFLGLMDLTDNDVLHSMQECISDNNSELKGLAERIVCRNHFKDVYTIKDDDIQSNPTIIEDLEKDLITEFSDEQICICKTDKGPGNCNFPVIKTDGEVVASTNLSSVLQHIPKIKLDTIYADRTIVENVLTWLNTNMESYKKGERP